MKIATYNVWNENKGIGGRFDQLSREINRVNADIIGLQEVTTRFFQEVLEKTTDYPYRVYRKYETEDEGLAILSRYPLEDCVFLHDHREYQHSRALKVEFRVGRARFSLINLHLPSESPKAQEDQLIAINNYLIREKDRWDYIIMLGDFNGGIHSSGHRYLTGEQTLKGHESNPLWDELSSAYSVLNDLPLRATLDCVNNPRWKGKNTFYLPSVMDRIYIMDNWVHKTLKSVEIFGTEVSPENQLAPSDHYGVVAEVAFEKGGSF